MNSQDDPEDRAEEEAGPTYAGRPWTEKTLALAYGTGDGKKPVVRDRLLNNRMRALFDDVEVRDNYKVPRRTEVTKGPFRGFMHWEDYSPPPSGPFELDPALFLAKARDLRPALPEATASAFASWVYSLYGRPGNDEEAMKRGLEAEKAIWEFGNPNYVGAREVWTGANANMLARRGDGWRLVHQGLHLKTETVPFFELDNLRVRGAPMRASPDLLFRNARTGHVLVVEIKLSRQSLPSNLWPNVWAQLWVYSHLPIVQAAPQVTVTGEVWGEKIRQGNRKYDAVHLVYLRAVVRRDPRAPAYDRFFRALFDIYRGEETVR